MRLRLNSEKYPLISKSLLSTYSYFLFRFQQSVGKFSGTKTILSQFPPKTPLKKTPPNRHCRILHQRASFNITNNTFTHPKQSQPQNKLTKASVLTISNYTENIQYIFLPIFLCFFSARFCLNITNHTSIADKVTGKAATNNT